MPLAPCPIYRRPIESLFLKSPYPTPLQPVGNMSLQNGGVGRALIEMADHISSGTGFRCQTTLNNTADGGVAATARSGSLFLSLPHA